MIIIKIKGGLGNQMFQYAVGRSIEKRKDFSVFYDLSFYHQHGNDNLSLRGSGADTPRNFGLQHFHTSIREASPEEVERLNPIYKKLFEKIKNKFSKQNWYSVNQHVLHPADNTYLEGWWQSEGYFKDIADTIRKDFTLAKPLGVAAQAIYMSIKDFRLPGTAPVSLHIRRGDFITNPYANKHNVILDVEHYKRALQELARRERKQLHVYVFSDDIEWAKANLQTDHTMHFVSCPEIEDYEEMMLMASCDHHIIANSTFSWWGAWLNPSKTKIVIAPKQWFQDPAINIAGLMPSDWIKI